MAVGEYKWPRPWRGRKAHEILWHQQLIHLLPKTIQEADKFVDGVPNVSNFNFVDTLTLLMTSINAKLACELICAEISIQVKFI